MTCVVRILGPFVVRSDDGTWIDRSAWRTSHAANLVRILASSPHHARNAAELAALLWPTKEAADGQTALRGALAEARRLLGKDHVVRRGAELALDDVWVDAQAFRRAAAAATAASQRGEARGAVAHALHALSHWQGTLAPDEPAMEWAIAERTELERLHHDLLLRAGEDALRARSWETARDMAEWAMQESPYSERAARTLLRAAAELGHVDEAVDVYARLRERLQAELGIAPSSTTDAIYQDILRSRTLNDEVPFVGRRIELALITTKVDEALGTGQPTIIHLVGPLGAGKSRLLQHFAATSRTAVALSPGAAGCRPLPPGDGSPAPVTILRDAPPERAGPWAAGLLAEGRPVVMLSSRRVADLRLPPGAREVVIPIGPMTTVEVGQLVEAWLGEPVSDALLEHVVRSSGCLPGPVVSELGELSRSLRLGYEDGRLTLLDEPAAPYPSRQPLVEIRHGDLALVEVIDATEQRGLLLDEQTVTALARLDIDASPLVIDRLSLTGVVVDDRDRIRLSGTAVQELRRLVPEPLRHSTARAVLVAALEHSLERLPLQWAAGDRDEVLATLEAAVAGVGRTTPDDELARLSGVMAHLLLDGCSPAHAVTLHLLLADLHGAVGHDEQEQSALLTAVQCAEAIDDERIDRLRLRLATLFVRAGEATSGLGHLRRSSARDEPAGLVLRGAAAACRDLRAAEDLLVDACETALARDDPAPAAAASLLLATRVYGPWRRLAEAAEHATRARDLAAAAGDASLLHQASTAGGWAVSLAGLRPWRASLAPEADLDDLDVAARRDHAVFRSLVQHDVGLPPSASGPTGHAMWPTTRPWSCWLLRLQVDRRIVGAAEVYNHLAATPDQGAMSVDGLYALPAVVASLTRMDRRTEALELVRRAIDFTRTSSATLVLPSLLLALVELADDAAQTVEPLAELEMLVRDDGLPGDHVALLRARAVRARLEGDEAQAGDLLVAAAETALSNGLTFAAADAFSAAAPLLRNHDPQRAEGHLTHARDLFQAAGAEFRVAEVTRRLTH